MVRINNKITKKMATIKPGKAAQEQERLLTQIEVKNGQLTLKLWNTKLERMETVKFDQEETSRIDGKLANPWGGVKTPEEISEESIKREQEQ